MALKPRFRFTPTPSGFLHRGNALNFVLVWWQAKLSGGDIILRIDDHDEIRVRDEYLENIFETLKWLGLDWDLGPRSVKEHKKNFSQSLKKNFYKKELGILSNTFFCSCSRKDLEGFDGVYPGICRNKALAPSENKHYSLRLNTDDIKLADETFKDCILWRKDDLPSYQWVSLIEDRDMKISHVIRGEDLKGSSEFQRSLAEKLGFTFPQNIYHHTLLNNNNQKISKSAKSCSLFEEFSSPEDFFKEVVGPYFIETWGEDITPKLAVNLLSFHKNLFS